MELFGNLITAKLDLINAEKKSEEIEIASREVSEKLKEINIRFRTSKLPPSTLNRIKLTQISICSIGRNEEKCDRDFKRS